MNFRMAVWLVFMFAVIHVAIPMSIDSFGNEKPQSLRAVASSINQFSTEFYETLSKATTENVVCSPLSAAMVLMMAAYGARGTTAEEMNLVLHSSNEQKSGIHSLIDQLNAVTKVELRLANKIFVASGMNIKDDFKATTETTFRSTAQSLDFTMKETASKEINSWCEEQTKSKIKDIIQPDDLSADTALILVNAVYFKGNWAHKFDENETQSRPFNLDDKTVKNVPMMHQLGNYRFGLLPEISARFIELPYESNDISDAVSMIIILPDDVNGLQSVEANLHKVNLARLLAGDENEVNLYMPKFKIETKSDLKDILSSMGMKQMFEDNANFTGIVDSPSLKVTKILQKAFIEVNEAGSEAAAATVIELENRLGLDDTVKQPTVFHINHPFLALIATEEVILFSARMVDPTL